MHTPGETCLTGHAAMPPHILVMEDESSVARGLEMILTGEGYEVDVALTGKSALAALENNGIDLVVADLRLPDIDGMEVIRHIRETRPGTEMIVISGYGTTETVVEALKLGVQDFLPKPFEEDQIKKAIGKALKEHTEKQAPPVVKQARAENEKLIQKREVIQVLNRSAEDMDFWTNLMETGSDALAGYALSGEAKAAIVSGDLRWIKENVGTLDRNQLKFVYKRLEREAW